VNVRRRPDTELIVLAREGSADAAEVLFNRYWAHAWRAAYAVTADRSLADDAAQEAIERAFAGLDRFDETRPFAPWLKRIVVNRAIDHLRRRRRIEALHDEQTTLHTWDLGESAAEDVGLWAVADAVAALGVAKRLVVVLHYWLDLPLEEIAGVLGLPVGTVASRLSRAKAELRVVLEEDRVV
jgi:RNA polymerase sigma-70 factor (ECF subfamily)